MTESILLNGDCELNTNLNGGTDLDNHLDGDCELQNQLDGEQNLDNHLDGAVDLDNHVDGFGMAAVDFTKPFNFRGEDAVRIYHLVEQKIQLSTTGFHTWTPSTTAKNIHSSSNLTTISCNMEQYEYFIAFPFHTTIKYNDGATNTGRIEKQSSVIYMYIHRHPGGYTAYIDNNFNTNYCTSALTLAGMDYWNTSGNRVFGYTNSYGLYISAPSISPSSSTATTPNFTIKSPQFNARCNNSYLSTTNCQKIDDTNTYLYYDCEVWRVKKGAFLRSAYEDVIRLLRL